MLTQNVSDMYVPVIDRVPYVPVSMRTFDNMVDLSCRVGKTELCKALASYMFDTEDALVGARFVTPENSQ